MYFVGLYRAVDVSIAFDKAPSRTQDLVSLLREVICSCPTTTEITLWSVFHFFLAFIF